MTEQLHSLSDQILRLVQKGHDLVAIAHIEGRAKGVPVVDFVEHLIRESSQFDMLEFVETIQDTQTTDALYWLLSYWANVYKGHRWI